MKNSNLHPVKPNQIAPFRTSVFVNIFHHEPQTAVSRSVVREKMNRGILGTLMVPGGLCIGILHGRIWVGMVQQAQKNPTNKIVDIQYDAKVHKSGKGDC